MPHKLRGEASFSGMNRWKWNDSLGRGALFRNGTVKNANQVFPLLGILENSLLDNCRGNASNRSSAVCVLPEGPSTWLSPSPDPAAIATEGSTSTSCKFKKKQVTREQTYSRLVTLTKAGTVGRCTVFPISLLSSLAGCGRLARSPRPNGSSVVPAGSHVNDPICQKARPLAGALVASLL